MMGSILSSEEIGRYYYIIALSSIISTVCLTPFGSYWEARVIENKDKFLLSFYCQFLQVLLVLFFIFIFLFYFLKTEFLNLIMIVGLGISTYLFTNACHQFNLNGYKKFSAVIAAFCSLLNVGIIFVSSRYITLNGNFWAYSIIVSNVFGLLVFLVNIYRISTPVTMQEIISKVVDNSGVKAVYFLFPVFIITLLVWGQQQLFRIIIEHFASLEFLGILSYCFAVSIAAYSACDTIFQQVILPQAISRISLAESVSAKLNTWRIKYYSIQFVVGISIFTGIAICSKPLMGTIGAGNYYNYWFLVVIGAAIEFIKSNINARYLIVRLIGQPKYALPSNLVLTILLSLSCCVLIYYESHLILVSLLLISYFLSLFTFKAYMRIILNDRSIDCLFKVGASCVSLLFVSIVLVLQGEVDELLVSLVSSSLLLVVFYKWFDRCKNDYL
ncbi:hypothetical protein ACRN93_04980 [Shewanella baltica]|uniref:hypothetical protein n=1 Tax=Shewanella baltica TaxID=62322 RepID=UPI003D78CDD4